MTSTMDPETTFGVDDVAPPPLPEPVIFEELEPRRRRRRRANPDAPPKPRVKKHLRSTMGERVGAWWRHMWYSAARSATARQIIRQLHWDTPIQSGTFTSTGQVVPLIPALTHTRPRVAGYPLGVDVWTRQPVCESAAGLYQAGIISGPNQVIIGGLGVAKSTLVKTTLARSIATEGGRGLVFDRKRQVEGGQASGEYTALSEAVNGTTIRVHQDPHLGTRINILDPMITQGTTTSMLGQDALLRMAAAAAVGSVELTTEQNYALSRAHEAALAAVGSHRVPVLDDVIQSLLHPAPTVELPGVDVDRVREWGLPVALGLMRYTTGDLAGLIDGPTTGPEGAPVDFDAPLLVFDTSALQMGSTALGVTMAIAVAYMMNVWVNRPGIKTVVLEETYSADGIGAVPAMIRDLAKRIRGVQGSMVSVFHHLSDVAPNSPLKSLITESDVVCVFRQDKVEDARAVMELLDLDEDWLELILTMRRGIHLRKRGNLPTTVVELVRTPLEARLTFTDHQETTDA